MDKLKSTNILCGRPLLSDLQKFLYGVQRSLISMFTVINEIFLFLFFWLLSNKNQHDLLLKTVNKVV